MAQLIQGNAVIGQSGGPTAVINQSLVGVVESIGKIKQIGKLLGARHGVRGIVEEKFIDLKKVGKGVLEAVAQTPAAALGSSRDKPDRAYCERIFKVFEKNNVRYFFYIGGNDSADAARIVNEMAKAAGYELRVFHVPKTIDNDLRVTDHCPGYGSAARFVASAFMGDDRDSASLPGIKINVVMGRHAGWLTAASVLGRMDAKCGPHLVYVPEVAFSLDRFVHDVGEVYGKLGRCQIAVSEGIADEQHKAIAAVLAEKLGKEVERDSHGNVQLSGSGALGDFLADYVKQELGRITGKKLRVRADTFGYLQRSFAGYASPIDQAEARMCGRKAVEFALKGDLDGSVAMKRAKGAYKISYFRAELKDVARETKDLPKSFINKAGNGVTPAFAKYALPLVGELPVIGKLA
ncbi:MAG TPA: 6-phosphofructokinase [Phycisphaerales bacterium]|nr:6-phosphofructokinase [Phycisphaerales bacterium]